MRFTTTRSLTHPLWTLVILFSLANTSFASAAKSGRSPGPATDSSGPWTSQTLDSPAKRQLQRAFPVALQRLEALVTCAGLFEELGADPVVLLRSSLYFPAKPEEDRKICRGAFGALAFTTIGSPVTRLCRKFASLRIHDAAQVILHEALHYAGLPEGPHTADALNSHQINLLVSKRCGL